GQRPLLAPSGRDDSGADDCAGGIAGLVSLKSASLVFASLRTGDPRSLPAALLGASGTTGLLKGLPAHRAEVAVRISALLCRPCNARSDRAHFKRYDHTPD